MNTVPKLIAFDENGKIGYANIDGKVIIPAEYFSEDSTREVTNQYFTAWKLESRSWAKEITGDESDQIKVVYCISSDGTQKTSLTDALYDANFYTEEIIEITDGYFEFFTTNRFDWEAYGIIRHDGKILSEPCFQNIQVFESGFRVSYQNYDEEPGDSGNITEGEGLLDWSGDFIIFPQYSDFEQINKHWFAGKFRSYSSYSGLWYTESYYTFIDISDYTESRELRLEIEQIFPVFHDKNLIEVSIHSKYGIFNLQTRNFLIDPVYTEIDSSFTNYLITREDEHLIIFDKDGLELNRYAPLIFSYCTFKERVFCTYKEKIVVKDDTVEIYKLTSTTTY